MTDVFTSGSTHTTTNGQAGIPVSDASHLTLTVNPGGKGAHLYLIPTDGETATADTTIDKVTW
jgi:hypothetical protein